MAVPTITSLTPSTRPACGTGYTLVVKGANYTASSVVQWNGSALATTYINGGEIRGTVPGANIASPSGVDITVCDPVNGTSLSTKHWINEIKMAPIIRESNIRFRRYVRFQRAVTISSGTPSQAGQLYPLGTN